MNLKIFFISLAVSFAAFPVFSQQNESEVISSPEGDYDFTHGIWFEFMGSATRSENSDRTAISAFYTLESRRLNAFAGIQAADEKFTFASDCRWYLCNGRFGKVGPEIVFSAERFSDISCRTNTFAGFYCQLDFLKYFFFGSDLLVGLKTTNFIGLDMDPLFKADTMMTIFLGFNSRRGTELKFSLKSHDKFQYPNFGYIYYSLDLRHDFKNGISFDLCATMRGLDMPAISSFIDGYSVSAAIGYRFK